MGWDPALTIPTLVGSVLSFVSSTMVVILWAVFGGQQGGQRRSFRYALILNLTFAELINSLNNSISGLYIAIHRDNHVLKDGPACNLNGYMGQFSVQAVDFSILAIAVVTLLTIQFKSYILYASLTTKILICLSIWIVPIITSSTAMGLHLYQPVSGNWCWITPKPVYLRYALTHGWRFAIILFTVCIYVYVFLYMRKRIRMRDSSGRSYSFDYGDDVNGFELNFRLENDGIGRSHTRRNTGNIDDFPLPPSKAAFGGREDSKNPVQVHVPARSQSPTHSEGEEELIQSVTAPPIAPPRVRIRHTTNIDKDVWKMMLLNLYPMAYCILWIPGISNRIVEATGGKSRVLAILQASTQYTGLANAMVYGFREHWEDIKFWWIQRR